MSAAADKGKGKATAKAPVDFGALVDASGRLAAVFGTTLSMPEFVDGPLFSGIAAVTTDYRDANKALPLFATVEALLGHLPEVAGLTAGWRRMYELAAILIAARKWYAHGEDLDGNAVVGKPRQGFDPTSVDTEWLSKVTDKDLALATLFVLCTKVNFWLINHHTGSGELASYAAKSLTIIADGIGETGVSAAAINACWTAGHWVSTKAALRSFGVDGIEHPHSGSFNPDAWPSPSRDIQMRIKSGPAGTAKYGAARAIVRAAAASPLSLLLPADKAYEAIMSCPDDLGNAAYHVGAGYLAGSPTEEIISIDDTTMTNLSAYVHAAMPKSTLCKSKSLVPKGEITANIVYIRITQVRDMLRDSDDHALAAALVMKAAGGGGGLDPLERVRPQPIITKEQIAAVQKEFAAKDALKSRKRELGILEQEVELQADLARVKSKLAMAAGGGAAGPALTGAEPAPPPA